MSQRRRRSAEFKAKVALEAIRAERTVNELAGLYQVHPTQVAAWKRRVLEGVAGLFGEDRHKQQKCDDELKAQLYQQIGELKVELDFLKKKSGLLA